MNDDGETIDSCRHMRRKPESAQFVPIADVTFAGVKGMRLLIGLDTNVEVSGVYHPLQ